jgi:single-strand DNA-binding protein
MLMGHLGRDPETKYLQNGTSVGNFIIATSKKWVDKNDQWQEHTEWHNIVVWRQLAERCEKRLKKGDLVLVIGEIGTEKWQDKSGNDRYTTKITAKDVKFLTPKSGTTGDDNQKNDVPF